MNGEQLHKRCLDDFERPVQIPPLGVGKDLQLPGCCKYQMALTVDTNVTFEEFFINSQNVQVNNVYNSKKGK